MLLAGRAKQIKIFLFTFFAVKVFKIFQLTFFFSSFFFVVYVLLSRYLLKERQLISNFSAIVALSNEEVARKSKQSVIK